MVLKGMQHQKKPSYSWLIINTFRIHRMMQSFYFLFLSCLSHIGIQKSPLLDLFPSFTTSSLNPKSWFILLLSFCPRTERQIPVLLLIKWGWTCTVFRTELLQDKPPPLSLILRARHGSSNGFLCLNNPFTPVREWEETKVTKGHRAPVCHISLPTLYSLGWKTVYLDNVTLCLTYIPHPLFQIKNYFCLPINVSRVVYQ